MTESSIAIITRAFFALLVVLCALCAVASLTWPLGYDHGSFAWIGSVVVDGGMPYRDAWDPKGPLVFIAHAAIQWVLGHNTWGLRLVDLLLIAGTTFVLARHLRGLTSSRTALWCCVLFPLAYASGVFQATAQPDGWVMMALVLTLIPAWSSSEGRGAIVGCLVAGVAVGAATLVKPFYAAFLPLALIRASASFRKSPDLMARAIAVLVSFALPIAATLVWFWSRGALQDLIDTYVLYTLRVHSGILAASRVTRITGVIDFIRHTPYVAATIPCVVVGVGYAWRHHRMIAIAWLVWACLAVGAVLLQNTFMVYHWLPLLPPLAIFFALGTYALLEESAAPIASLPGSEASLADSKPAEPGLSREIPAAADGSTRRAARGNIRLFVAASVACVAFHVSIHPAFDVARFIAYVAGINDADAYAMGFTTPGPDRLAARHLREHSSPEETVVIWGWNTSILFLSERQSPSRFGDNLALVNGPGTPERAALRREFLAAIDRAKPAYIVVDEDNREMFGRPATLADFEEFARIVAEEYREEARFHSRVIYHRR